MIRVHFLAGLAAASSVSLRSEAIASDATTARVTHVRLGEVGNVCEAVTITAPNSLAFKRRGLAAEVVRFGSERALVAALDAGTIDAASLKLPSLIAALDAGRRVRVAAGLHSGCMSVLTRDIFAFKTVSDLKGQTIGTDRLRGPAMRLLMAIVAKQGLDPHRDVAWREYSGKAFGAALQAHDVNCVAVSDPIGYELQTTERVEPFLDTSSGGFSCGEDVASGHHCFLAIGAGLVERRPALAASLTRAYLEGSAAFGKGVGAAQVDEFGATYAIGRGETIGMLSSYDWNASTDLVVEELELTVRDFLRAGLVKSRTNSMDFAERAFADLADA
jgi:NitT/TauT family transport system substrate-binding protein